MPGRRDAIPMRAGGGDGSAAAPLAAIIMADPLEVVLNMEMSLRPLSRRLDARLLADGEEAAEVETPAAREDGPTAAAAAAAAADPGSKASSTVVAAVGMEAAGAVALAPLACFPAAPLVRPCAACMFSILLFIRASSASAAVASPPPVPGWWVGAVGVGRWTGAACRSDWMYDRPLNSSRRASGGDREEKRLMMTEPGGPGPTGGRHACQQQTRRRGEERGEDEPGTVEHRTTSDDTK